MTRNRFPFNSAPCTNGCLYVADGMNGMRRWDPLLANAELAGVAGPTQTPIITGSGGGAIWGPLYAYTRFVDRLGYYSNVSPISLVYNAGGAGGAGTISSVTFDTPIIVYTSAPHGLSSGAQVSINGVQGITEANGVWIVTVISNTSFSLNGSYAVNTPINGTGTWASGVISLNYSNLAASPDGKAVRRQILRNKPGELSVFYIDIDTTDLTSDNLSSTNADANLTGPLSMSLFQPNGDDGGIELYSVPPNWKTAVVSYLSRLWAAVDRVYSDGNVSVTNGSATASGIGTEWTAALVGRLLYVDAAGLGYSITAVNAAAQTLTLSVVYADATEPYASYSVRSAPAEEWLIRFSEAMLPEAWQPDSTLPVSIDPQSGPLTAIIPTDAYLYAFGDYRSWRISTSGDPRRDAELFPAGRRGCVNQRCWVLIDNAAYILDRSGMYRYDGFTTTALAPQLQDIFRFDAPNTTYRINWDASEYFHCVFSPAENVVRWFVSLGESYTPRHAVVYALDTEKTYIEGYPFCVGSSALGYLNGRPQPFLGSEAGNIKRTNVGTLDGPDAGQGVLRGAVTSATLLGLTDSAQVWPATGLVGAPVQIVDGTGKGQQRVVVDASAATGVLTINLPWITLPDSTSVYQIGGVAWTWRSGWLTWLPDDEEQQRWIELTFKPLPNPAMAAMHLYKDRDDAAAVSDRNVASALGDGVSSRENDSDLMLDLTWNRGLLRYPIDNQRETRATGNVYIAVELEGTSNADPLQIYQIDIDGAT